MVDNRKFEPRPGWRTAWAVAAAGLAWGAMGSVAAADALVLVEVRGASASGTVELRPREGSARSCQTVDHRCRLDGVPGGRYQVSFQGQDGSLHRAQPAMIPPRGTVTLVIPVTR